MRVELFGQSGSGKTTLAKAVERGLEERGQPVRLISRPGLQSASWPLRRLQNVKAAISQTNLLISGLGLLSKAEALDRRHIGLVFELLNRAESLAKLEAPSSIIRLIDEGSLHGVWSLTFELSCCDLDRLRDLLRNLRWPDVAISVQLSPEEAYQRIVRGKKTHRALSMSQEDVLSALRRQQMVLDEMEGFERESCRLIRIDGSQVEPSGRIDSATLERILDTLIWPCPP